MPGSALSAGAPPGLDDDQVRRPGDPLKPGDLQRHRGGVADGGDDLSLAVCHQREPVDGRTDRSQVSQFTAPQLRRAAADPGDRLQDEAADGTTRRSLLEEGIDLSSE